jgi:hypothetical protein
VKQDRIVEQLARMPQPNEQAEVNFVLEIVIYQTSGPIKIPIVIGQPPLTGYLRKEPKVLTGYAD